MPGQRIEHNRSVRMRGTGVTPTQRRLNMLTDLRNVKETALEPQLKATPTSHYNLMASDQVPHKLVPQFAAGERRLTGKDKARLFNQEAKEKGLFR